METSSRSSRSSVGVLSPQLTASPQRPVAASPQKEPVPTPQREPFQPVVGSPHQVASRDEITIQEQPSIPLLQEQIPAMDLPLLDGTELNMNLRVTDEPALTAQDLLPSASTPAVPPPEKKRKTRRKQDKDKRTEVSEAEIAPEKTPDRHPPEEIPEARAVPPSPGVTLPVITSPLPRRQQINLDPLLETASPARKKRKRQLGFADAETQIPKALLKRNFTNTEDITENFLLPAAKPLSANDLMTMPTGRDLKDARLLPLWRRNAVTQANPLETETPEASSPSDIQSERAVGESRPVLSPEFTAVPLAREVQLSPVLPPPDVSGVERPSIIDESLEALRKATSVTSAAIIEDIEMPSMEQARDMSTSIVEPAEQRSIDTSLQELEDSARKDTSLRKRRRTRSAASTSLLIEPEPSGREPSVSRSLYDVQEEQEHRIPEASDIQPPEVILPAQILEEVTVDPAKAVEALLSEIEEDQLSTGETETTFRSLCPPALTDRKTATAKFTALLDLCAQRILTARQPVAYGDISISLAQEGDRQG